MEKSEFQFVYQSELQSYAALLTLFAGVMVGMLPLLALTDDFFPPFDLSMCPEKLRPIVLVACCASVVIGAIVGVEVGIRFVSTGTLQLHGGYAVLCYGKKAVQLKKNEFRIIQGTTYTKFSQDRPQKYWILRFDGHSIYFNEVTRSKVDGRGIYDPSLGLAMAELEASGLPKVQ